MIIKVYLNIHSSVYFRTTNINIWKTHEFDYDKQSDIFFCFHFQFILNFLYKVATGQMKEVDDLREEEVTQKLVKANKQKQNAHTHNR